MISVSVECFGIGSDAYVEAAVHGVVAAQWVALVVLALVDIGDRGEEAVGASLVGKRERRLAVGAPEANRGARVEEAGGDVACVVERGDVQRGVAVGQRLRVERVGVQRVEQRQPRAEVGHHLVLPRAGRMVEARPAVAVLPLHVGALGDEHRAHVGRARARRGHEWRPMLVVEHVDRHVRLEVHVHEAEVAWGRRKTG